MMDPLSFGWAMTGAISFMFGGWIAYVPIWIIAKFSLS